MINGDVRMSGRNRNANSQNGVIASFNGEFRDECIDRPWFTSLNDAIATVEAYRMHSNTQRLHSSLDYQTLAEKFADYRRRCRQMNPARGASWPRARNHSTSTYVATPATAYSPANPISFLVMAGSEWRVRSIGGSVPKYVNLFIVKNCA